MVSKMESTKKNVSSKKNAKKVLFSETTKRKLLFAGVISAVVIICGGYFAYTIGLPAKILTGATIAGENISVVEFNYNFNTLYASHVSAGDISTDTNLDSILNQETGQTYREYISEEAAIKIQAYILLNEAAKADGFKPKTVEKQVDAFVDSARTEATLRGVTADQLLTRRYGVGTTVRIIKNIMTRELSAQEYSEYLKQTKYALTQDEMMAMYQASPSDYETVSYHFYAFPGSTDAAATEAEKATALAAAKVLAQGVMDASTDGQSFRDACEAAAGAAAASSFADGADPTIRENDPKSMFSFNTEFSDFLFSPDRKNGDTTLIEADNVVYAVYFLSRQLDETQAVSFRSLTIDASTDLGASVEEIQAAKDAAALKAEKYKSQVTDENSFISLVKKYADANSATGGGLVVGLTAERLVSDPATATAETLALSDWLFSADRKPGDMTIIPGGTAYTLFYFQKSLPAWQETLFEENISNQYNAWMTALVAEPGNGYKINYDMLKFATY